MNKTLLMLILLFLFNSLTFAALRDPTLPPANMKSGTVITPGMFVLSAILIRPHQRIAVINGAGKKIGDEVLGQQITSINENSVQLIGPSGKIMLFLLDSSIKRPVSRQRNPVCMEVKKELCYLY